VSVLQWGSVRHRANKYTGHLLGRKNESLDATLCFHCTCNETECACSRCAASNPPSACTR
jgi:hypothetical protein